MKNIVFIIPLVVITLSGCSIKSVFDGSDMDVLIPLDSSEVLGAKNNDFFNGGDFTYLAASLFEKLIDEDVIQGNTDCAIVLNDPHFLSEVWLEDDQVIQWPDIDFENYSLVVGRWVNPGTTWYIKEQRAKKNVLGKVVVYLHFVKILNCRADRQKLSDMKKIS